MPPKLVKVQVEMKQLNSPGDILVKQLNESSLQMHYVNSFDNDTNRAMISCLAPNCKLMRAKPISTPITSTNCAGSWDHPNTVQRLLCSSEHEV